jgi:hypothetical protein
MKNYYAEFLEKKNTNTPETQVTIVPIGQNTPQNESIVTFGTYRFGVNPKNSIFSTPESLREFNEKWERLDRQNRRNIYLHTWTGAKL